MNSRTYQKWKRKFLAQQRQDKINRFQTNIKTIRIMITTAKRYRVMLFVGQYKQNNNQWLACDNAAQIHSMITDRIKMYEKDVWFKAIVFGNGYEITPSFITQARAIMFKQPKEYPIIFVQPNASLNYISAHEHGLFRLGVLGIIPQKPITVKHNAF